MILKTFCSFLALLLEFFGAYGEGQFNWHYGYALFTYHDQLYDHQCKA